MTGTDGGDEDLPTLEFAAGLPGFPDARRFALVQWGDAGGPFSILTAPDGTGPEFLVAPAGAFFPDYAPELEDDTAERLGLAAADDALLLVIINVGDDPAMATANLLAPIVVNRHSRAAAQVVLTDADASLHAPLFGAPR